MLGKNEDMLKIFKECMDFIPKCKLVDAAKRHNVTEQELKDFSCGNELKLIVRNVERELFSAFKDFAYKMFPDAAEREQTIRIHGGYIPYDKRYDFYLKMTDKEYENFCNAWNDEHAENR